MTRVCALVTVHGNIAYYRAARLSVRSLLRHTPFDVVVAAGSSGQLGALASHERVRPLELGERDCGHRAHRFLRKFEAARAGLEVTDAELVLMMDADAVVVAPIDPARVESALDGSPLGMAEQTTIRGTGWTRRELMAHYVTHTLAWFGQSEAPDIESFRFYNSGVVLARRDALAELACWAAGAAPADAEPQVGEHMIADQDYLQYWADRMAPGRCRQLSWRWNHCEHWDDWFPRPGALILHFSNFCLGPGRRQLWRMRSAGLPGAIGRWTVRALS